MIELSSQAIFLQDSAGCAAPFDPDDLAARIRSVLPDSGDDPEQRAEYQRLRYLCSEVVVFSPQVLLRRGRYPE